MTGNNSKLRAAVANASLCLSRGGSERAAVRLVEEMRQRGHDAWLLTVASGKPPLYAIKPDTPVHFLPFSFFQASPEAVGQGAAFLRQNNIDILVSFESGRQHETWFACAARAQVPFVLSERITPHLVERSFWNREGRHKLLAASAGIHELLPCYLKHVPRDLAGRAFVIPNAAPENLPAEYSRPGGDFRVLLYLGRFSRQKRPWLLAEAFALLAEEFPQWRLRLAGWGEEREKLERLRAASGLADRIEIRSAHEDVAREYRQADIYCLPSLYEGFPNSVLEAQAYGLPVVGLQDCEAMSSIMAQGKTGLLAKPSPQGLAQALAVLMASEDLRGRMGRQGWIECREKYGSARIFDLWEKNLTAMAAGPAKR